MPNCLAMRTTRGAASPGVAPATKTTAAAAAKTQKCLRKFMLILPVGFAFVLVPVSSPRAGPGGKPRSSLGSDFMSDLVGRIEGALAERFGERFHADAAPAGQEALACMAAFCECRRYQARDVAIFFVFLL